MELGKIDEIENIDVFVMEGPDATVWFYQGLKHAGNLALNWVKKRLKEEDWEKNCNVSGALVKAGFEISDKRRFEAELKARFAKHNLLHTIR